MNPEGRWDETLAIRCISAELGVEGVVHDNETEQSMHDLNVMYECREPGADPNTRRTPHCSALRAQPRSGERDWPRLGLRSRVSTPGAPWHRPLLQA